MARTWTLKFVESTAAGSRTRSSAKGTTSLLQKWASLPLIGDLGPVRIDDQRTQLNGFSRQNLRPVRTDRENS